MSQYHTNNEYRTFFPITIMTISMAVFSSSYSNNNQLQNFSNSQNEKDNNIKNNIEAILVNEEKVYKNQTYTLIPRK
jgi:hypothetical protein